MTTATIRIEAQFPPLLHGLFKPSRYKVLWGGRGGAKSWGAARALLLTGQQQPLRILCCREFQRSISDSVHRLLVDQIYELGLESFYHIEQASITGENGTEFRFSGLKSNIQQVKSFEGVDRVWCEEASNISKLSWQTLIPTIRKENSEVWITMNPELQEDYSYQQWILNPPPDAWVQEMSWRDNPWFPEPLRKEMEHMKATRYEDYLHVYEGHCRMFTDGAVYLNEIRQMREEGRLCRVPYDPSTAVHAFFDLGYADATGIWFAQRCGFETHFIEYYENTRQPLDHYLNHVRTRDYPVDFVHLPHDAKAKSLGTGKSIEEITRAKGFSVKIVKNLSIADGINAFRQLCPTLWVDEEMCAVGVRALQHYRYELLPDGHGAFKNAPVHDKFSHACDSARYSAIGLKAPRELPDASKYATTYGRMIGSTASGWMSL